MFLGPPAVRLAVDEDRTGLSSLSGDQDIWNYLRLAWWLLFGGLAILSLVKQSGALKHMLGRVGLLPYWVGLFLICLMIASFASWVPLFCIANATMMFMLAAAATDLAVKVYTGAISTSTCLRAFLWLSVGLLVFVGALYILYPHLRWSGWFGYRLRGESFAYVPILALVCVVLGAHFFLAKKGVSRLTYLVVVGFGFYWLYLAQTRSAYLCLAVAFAVLAWYHLGLGRKPAMLAGVVVTGIAGIVVVLMLYGNSSRVTWYLDNLYMRFVVRDYWAMQDATIHARSLSTLNGRTEAADVLIDGILDRPYGYGYIGGVRAYMSQPHVLERLPDDAFIGAHNGYLEVLGGGGILAFLAYMLIIGSFVYWSFRHGNVEAKVVQALLLMVLVEGFFESEIAYPFHQSPVVLWFAGALITAAVARAVATSPVQAKGRQTETPQPTIRAVGQLSTQKL